MPLLMKPFYLCISTVTRVCDMNRSNPFVIAMFIALYVYVGHFYHMLITSCETSFVHKGLQDEVA